GVFVEMKRSGQLTARLVHYDEFGTDTSINSESPRPWAIGFFFSFFFNLFSGYLWLLQNFEFSEQVSGMLAIGVIAPVGVLAPHVFKFSRRRFAKNSIPP